MRSADRVPPPDGPASVGMSSIFCTSTHAARRLLAGGVGRVVQLPSLVDVLIGLFVFRERQAGFVGLVGAAAALVVGPMAFVVERERSVEAVLAFEMLEVRQNPVWKSVRN